VKISLFILALLFTFQNGHEELTGKVVRIADGDTFTMLIKGNKQIKVRLYGIDAPEKGQDFSAASKKFLSDMIFTKTVKVIKKDVDRYGRTIGLVNIENLNINEALLKAGLAWHYKQHNNNVAWSTLESEARNKKKGLWSLNNATPPWNYRKEKRKKYAQQKH
jgi:micrococcal nuclease